MSATVGRVTRRKQERPGDASVGCVTFCTFRRGDSMPLLHSQFSHPALDQMLSAFYTLSTCHATEHVHERVPFPAPVSHLQ